MDPIATLASLKRVLADDFPGGPRFLKLAWVTNLQKGGTLFFVLALMFASGNFSAAAWTYLALHGSYGLVWLMKHVVMPDPSWERRVTIGGALNAFLFVLGPYWLAPILLITDVAGAHPEPSPWVMGASSAVYAVGVVVMMVADAQKFFTLKARRGLITDGMFKHIRHPNYLGEMMVYGAFAFLSQHWIPWVVLAWVWIALFLPNIVMKERSMARYAEWAAYQARTGYLLPRLMPRPPAVDSPPGKTQGDEHTAGAHTPPAPPQVSPPPHSA
jgi:protein-S-isoprenylcysteine O-methyltransferase Ste14